MLVSVIVLCYNHEAYVGDCIKSILHQTYRRLEVLILDDCSADRSYEVIRSYERELGECFERIEISRNPENRGIIYNLNQLIPQARGKYIVTLASDDMLLESGIEEMVSCMEAHEEYDVLYCNGIYIGASDHFPIEHPEAKRKFYDHIPYSGKHLTEKLCERNFIHAAAAFFRRQTFETYGLYDSAFFYEDWEYWLRISVNGCIGYCDCMAAAYRKLESSLSHFTVSEEGRVKKRRFTEEEQRILEKYSDFCTDQAWSGFYNSRMVAALYYGDKAYAGELRRRLEEKNLKLTMRTRVVMILSRLRLYRVLYDGYKRLGNR